MQDKRKEYLFDLLFGALPSGAHPASSDQGEHYDAFLSHNWGKDESGRDNHARVLQLAEILIQKGLKIWIDATNMEGKDIENDMTEGIDSSRFVVVFATQKNLC